jgi:hypothetical protein
MLTSIAIVAGCAVPAAPVTAIQLWLNGPSVLSFVPLILAALLGGVIVLTYGLVAKERSAVEVDSEKANTDQPL